MKSPKHMRVIEIDITNVCNKRCANCTRLCGHHTKPFFMDFDTFKRAVDSLDGYQGIRSMMGGEPTLHPEFERFVRYLGSKFPPHEDTTLIYPQMNFINAVQRIELRNLQYIDDEKPRMAIVGAGMFSNMSAPYKKYYELIADMLPFQGLNDHLNVIYHQSALITRGDLGIPDDEWHKLRDACWLQNEWSAGITPKGAFFCEVAGVLDMLFDGPGGWPIEPGWWKREPGDFGDQLHWCEMCGFALSTFTRDSAEEIDDVSPTMYEKLKEIDSPKLKSGRVNLLKIENGQISEDSKKENKRFSSAMPYIERYEDRFNALNSVLFTKDFEFAVIGDGDSFGISLNKLLGSCTEWIVLHSPNAQIADDFCERMSKFVLNPGTMHYIDLSKSDDTLFVKNADTERSGYAAMFSKNALSLREFGFDRIAHTKSFVEILNMWQSHKIVELSSKILEFNLPDIDADARYIIWGAGSAGAAAFKAVFDIKAQVAAIADSNCQRHGDTFCGVEIVPPEKIRDIEFDYLIIANYTQFTEMKSDAISMGIDEDRILLMTDLYKDK